MDKKVQKKFFISEEMDNQMKVSAAAEGVTLSAWMTGAIRDKLVREININQQQLLELDRLKTDIKTVSDKLEILYSFISMFATYFFIVEENFFDEIPAGEMRKKFETGKARKDKCQEYSLLDMKHNPKLLERLFADIIVRHEEPGVMKQS